MAALPPTKRRELGDFLRAHRARLSPASLGLPAIGRRRTPGLRREEVAQACGMSPTWYTWLEQGRDIAASPPALSALARALQLTPAERAYLFELADRRDPNLSGSTDKEGMDVPPALARAIAAIDGPAYLLDSLWNARAWNRPAAALFVGWLDEASDRNLLRYVFLSPVARKIIPDWQARARRVLAEFRADSSRHLEDAELQTLVEDLRGRSALFAQCWTEHAVVDRTGGERIFDHPREGRLRYQQIAFALANRPDFKLVMLVPEAPRKRRATA
ncbi:helix-turn-helix transcriptional regulator [Reyranella soli]|jgi:transcriptional regulator with XRE-family HTH domain|uniref:Transcriptional regulator n=1 Tax=Reyranella soli TaxID=1230389 RepID=A0A512NMG0_9HYPH|nr:helix-turn-helix transcriptional regulator [Reyranella soli]GEP60133.1 transcriptional regulator [Reyranella soli]